MDRFFEMVAETVAPADRPLVHPGAAPADLQLLDSLLVLLLIDSIETEFRAVVTGPEIRNAASWQALWELIAQRRPA